MIDATIGRERLGIARSEVSTPKKARKFSDRRISRSGPELEKKKRGGLQVDDEKTGMRW